MRPQARRVNNMDGYANYGLLAERLALDSDKTALTNLEMIRINALNEFSELTKLGKTITLDGVTYDDVKRHSMTVEEKERVVFSLGWECLKEANSAARDSFLDQDITLHRLETLPHCAMLHVLAMIENVTDGDGAPQIIVPRYNFYLVDDTNNVFRGLIAKMPLFYPKVPVGKIEAVGAAANPAPEVAQPTPVEQENTANPVNPSIPSPELVRKLIDMYRQAKTQAERDSIISPLIFNLSKIPLIFPTDANIPQTVIDSAKDFKPGDTFSLQEHVGGNVMSFQQDGTTYVPAFTDSAASSKSNIPFSISLSMHPSTYIPMLKDKTYDKVVIDPENGVGMFAMPKELFEKLMMADEAKTCCIFNQPTAEDAGRNLSFDIIEEYSHSDYTYSWNKCTQRLIKCKKCGALFLQKFYCFKAMRYEDDDKYYTYYYPVDTREEALAYAARDGMTFESSFKGDYIKLINQQWQWNKQ